VATLHPFPVVVEGAPPDLSLNPTRQRLAEAIATLDSAHAEVELAAEPVRRLSDVIAEHDRLAAQLRELRDRDETATGAWIASGRQGADPSGDAADTRSLSDRIAAMQTELAAARRTLPEAEQQHQAAIARLGEAAAARGVALDEVAVLVANGVAGELTEALNQALTVEAKLLGLHNALLERARDHTNSNAGHAAERIAVMIRAAKRSAAVPRAPESGRRLLAALATDPGATLT
jgi:hypothetical protein